MVEEVIKVHRTECGSAKVEFVNKNSFAVYKVKYQHDTGPITPRTFAVKSVERSRDVKSFTGDRVEGKTVRDGWRCEAEMETLRGEWKIRHLYAPHLVSDWYQA